MYPTLHHLSIC